MLIHPRPVSISIAILCLFVISFIGWFSDLPPLVCCERALIGAFAVYILTGIVVGIINRIVLNALVQSQIDKQKREISGRGN